MACLGPRLLHVNSCFKASAAVVATRCAFSQPMQVRMGSDTHELMTTNVSILVQCETRSAYSAYHAYTSCRKLAGSAPS